MTATITVQGGLTAAPEFQMTGSGTPFVTGTVASTERYQDRKTGEWVDGKKLFARYTAWGVLAENIAESNLVKGTQVTVTGKLHTREFEHQGQKRSSTELEVTDFAVSLRHATANVTRATPGGGSGSSSGAAASPWSSAGHDEGYSAGFDDEPF